MNNSGFTLIELITVIAFVAIIGVSSVIIFEQSTSDTKDKELQNTYTEIQRAASLYVDLHDTWLDSFSESHEAIIKIGELKNTNYVSNKIKNPVTNKKIPDNYMVRLYVNGTGDNAYLDSCIINYVGSNINCISNSDGNPCECCDYPINTYNISCN